MQLAMKAIDLAKITDDAFHTNSTGQRLAVIERLPRELITPPFDTERMAVLSWRWDLIETPQQASRNVYVAIQEALGQGMDYLFMDMVSIDQTLEGDSLIQEVVAFSELYAHLPVMATYDKADTTDEWIRTMRRPWIFHETTLYRHNPTHITYVAHIKGQGDSGFGFEHMIDMVWRTSINRTIVYVLLDELGMGNIADFRYILFKDEAILAAAHEKMSRNDYLLTAALLATDPELTPRLNDNQTIESAEFEQYSLGEEIGTGLIYQRDIVLGDTKVAEWHQTGMNNQGDLRYKMYCEATLRDVLRQYLGIPKQDNTFELDYDHDAPKPPCRVSLRYDD